MMKFYIQLFIALIGALQAQAAPSNFYEVALQHYFNNTIPAHIMEQDELSLLTRYAGMGYNLLEGNPEGSSTLGGLDPGIKTTRYIVDHTYTQNKVAFYRGEPHNVPDQVEFQMSDACTTSSRANTFSGETSYKNELSLSTTVSGGYEGLFKVAFSLSYNMKNVQERTEKSKKVVLQKSEICNYGRAHYKLSNALAGVKGYTLTEEFMNAVRNLPGTYSIKDYVHFLNDWGTHMIETVDLGRRSMNRSESTYHEVYSRLLKENSGSLDFSGSYGGGNVGVKFDLSSLQDTVDSKTEMGETKETAVIGSVAVPLPISYTELVPITVVMTKALWGTEWSSVMTKADNLRKALEDYPQNRKADIKKDPLLGINAVWPDEQYVIVRSSKGCPQGLAAGYFRHDSENDNSNLVGIISVMQMTAAYQQGLGASLDITADKDFTTVHYCSKTSTTSIGIPWQQGSYCLARYGDSCPKGFYKGSIKWDDEDDDNQYAVQQPAPPYGSGKNPTIQYCCRSDGDTETPLFLPTQKPFGLYRYGGRCQKVRGMKELDIIFIFDTENSWVNESNCSGNHPDDEDCKGDHKLHYCSYLPTES